MVRHASWFGARFAGWVAIMAALGASGCGDKPQADKPKASAGDTGKKEELKYGLTAEQAAQVLVKVGDTKITLGDFAERLGGQSPYLRARYNSPERRREFLDNMVRFELLALEAQKRGYASGAEVTRVREQMMVQQMMQDLFDKQGVKLADVTDAEIEQYYNAHKSEFDKPAQVRASAILISDKAAATKVLAQAKANPDDMAAFQKLAAANNQDPTTKDAGGDLRFFSAKPDPENEAGEPERPEAVRKAAFALQKVGDVSPDLVQTPKGFYIVKLTAKRDAMTRTLEDARRMIQNRIWRQKREDAIEKFVGELRGKANIKESPELLAKVQAKAAPAQVESK